VSNFDDGESFAAGDELDRIDWRKLRLVRKAIELMPDPNERRLAQRELLETVFGDELDIR